MPTSTTGKPVDLFKPLYKRDKHLPSATDCADILDAETVVAAAQADGGSTKIGPYTVNLQGYKLAQTDETSDTQTVMEQIFTTVAGSSDIQNYQVPQVLTVEELPGLVIIPHFLPIQVQRRLVDHIIEDLIPHPAHMSNLDAHYANPQPSMRHLFDDQYLTNPDYALRPLDPAIHGPLSLQMVQSKKLRWITLGGQYNWTTKVYPSFTKGDEGFPSFPPTVAPLFSPPLFNVQPEAAIVNFYAPGDTLSPHQDVAEISKADLVSMSIGCDAVFYVGLDRYDQQQLPASAATNGVVNPPLQIRVRSGDVVIMGGATRAAFHGVGRVWANTSPDQLVATVNPKYADWLRNKRININVRQMLS